jgi:hypothetical protein
MLAEVSFNDGIADLISVDTAIDIFRFWLAENGLVVVPKEATDEMLARASLVEVDDIELTPSEYQAAWQAMLSAAPDALRDGEKP